VLGDLLFHELAIFVVQVVTIVLNDSAPRLGGLRVLRVLRRISRTAASVDCFFFVMLRLSSGL
jgi:hypothetical protein